MIEPSPSPIRRGLPAQDPDGVEVFKHTNPDDIDWKRIHSWAEAGGFKVLGLSWNEAANEITCFGYLTDPS